MSHDTMLTSLAPTIYEQDVRIRFSHCDPAGIVYFPQYLVLCNWLVEDWFTEGLQVDFAELISQRRFGIPLAKLQCEFLRPSQHGDKLRFSLGIARLGGRSLGVSITAHADGATRFQCEQTMVMTSLDTGLSTDFPPDLRRALEQAAAQGRLGSSIDASLAKAATSTA